MTDNDNLLIEEFFKQATRQQIEDNGFTERVMNQLPGRMLRFERIWTAGCIVIAAILFTFFHGWELLIVQAEVWLRTTLAEVPQVSPLMAVFALFSLLLIGAYELINYERVVR